MQVIFPIYHFQEEHLGVMYLSAALKGRGHSVEVVRATPQAIVDALRQSGPTVLAYSVMSMLAQHTLEVNHKALSMLEPRDRPRLVIMGGPHATFFPEVVEEDGVDAICIGEGEEILIELLDALEQGRDVRRIQGLWFRDEREVRKNPLRPPVGNLDSLPHPDRSLFSLHGSTALYRASVIASRGCPYDCPYCFNHAYKELFGEAVRQVRHRSVENVLDELRGLRRCSSIRLIMFEDDIFGLEARWLREFAPRYREEIGLPYHCQVRPETVSRESAGLLALSGCRTATIGVETGDERLRAELLRRRYSNSTLIDACRALREAGIRVNTTSIIGLPGVDIDKDLETLALNVACRPTYARVHMLYAYPGTEIHRYARERGLLVERYEGVEDPLFPTVLRTSSIVQRTPLHTRMVANLHKLFPLAVRFVAVRALVPTLIPLPLRGLYSLVGLAYEGYTSYFLLFPLGWRALPAGLRKYFELMRLHRPLAAFAAKARLAKRKGCRTSH